MKPISKFTQGYIRSNPKSWYKEDLRSWVEGVDLKAHHPTLDIFPTEMQFLVWGITQLIEES